MERAIRMDVAGTCHGGATKVVAGARYQRYLPNLLCRLHPVPGP
jgi:hypothetical protein